ncbi:MAG TPA: NADH-ubiquinone oxidoreductase-F iron-sulfur binding region domain-containing protein [Leifsonia sp.]|jgi:NADH:ubiquinone oxidoreductase subunit F (NADH-binding)|nr:NADH-ubiquinone oxidoreductase-F iron-sulfur binding region domain-containing protein [Leifsonia sp.]
MTMTLDSASFAAVDRPAGAKRLLAAGHEAAEDAHLRTFGPLPLRKSAALLTELEASGLAGRGGAGFPTWRKLAAAENSRSSRSRRHSPIVIGNGGEGEPLSWKDAVLLQNAPHLVIDGLLTAARAIGAGNVILSVGSDTIAAVRAAIDGRSDDARHIELVVAADGFVSGEAGAVVNAIENGDPRPTDRTIRLTESGLNRRPTLVQNVETLAHLGLIARFGADWFRTVGAPDDPGTRLVTVTGDVAREGVFEVATDTTVEQVIRSTGTDPASASAALVGGYHGTWIPSAAFSAPLSPRGLEPFDARPGAGIVHVLGRNRCGLSATASMVSYLAGETAGQCGPCMFGLPALAVRFSDLARGTAARANAAELVRLSDSIVGRGACYHPDGTVRLIRSALATFAGDVRSHAAGYCTRTEG